jgi:hypothetical protein
MEEKEITMSTLQTQYQNYLKENPESTFTFEEWSDWKFSNMEILPPHNGLRPLDEHACSLGRGDDISDWDVTLMDGLENEPYISDDFQIGPDGAYEHIEYSIPIYENGIKTEWSVDGIVGDEKYYQLLELGNGKDLPVMINTRTKK